MDTKTHRIIDLNKDEDVFITALCRSLTGPGAKFARVTVHVDFSEKGSTISVTFLDDNRASLQEIMMAVNSMHDFAHGYVEALRDLRRPVNPTIVVG